MNRSPWSASGRGATATAGDVRWRRVPLPASSVLAARAGDCDHVDSVRFELGKPVSLDVALNVLGAPLPGPVAAAMRLRDGVVGRFGLKTSAGYRAGDPDHPIRCEVGDRIGSFTVYQRTGTEAVVGEDDRHLDFRVSVLVEEAAVTITTMVFFRNGWGRWYFTAIKPFHLAMVPRTVAGGLRRHLAR